MGNFYEDMFTGGSKKKKSSSKPKPYDWMRDAVSSTGMNNNPAMNGIDIDSIVSSSNKSKSKQKGGSVKSKTKEPDFMDSIKGIQTSVNNIKRVVKTVKSGRSSSDLPTNHKEIIAKAKALKDKERIAKEVQEAKDTIADYQTRQAEYEARRKEREPPKQGVLERLRNLRRNNGNGTPEHVKPSNGNNS